MRRFAIVTGALLLPAAVAFGDDDAAARLSDAFIERGMPESKASCYGTTIGGRLDSKHTTEAASILESAENSREVREGVMNSGFKMVDAFSAAHEECGS